MAVEKGLVDRFTISRTTFRRGKAKLRGNQSLPKHSGTKLPWKFVKSAVSDLEEEDQSVEQKEARDGVGEEQSLKEDIDQPIDASLVESVVKKGVRPEENNGEMFSEMDKWRKE